MIINENKLLHTKNTNWERYRQVIEEQINLNISLKTLTTNIENTVKIFSDLIQTAVWTITTIINDQKRVFTIYTENNISKK